jgi:hypothetical protein
VWVPAYWFPAQVVADLADELLLVRLGRVLLESETP